MYVENLKKYLDEAKKIKIQYPECYHFFQVFKFFTEWNNSLKGKASPLTDEQPWITFAAIELLKKILRSNMRVFEYGSGGSTFFFAKRVNQVISIEHDKTWYKEVVSLLSKKKYNNSKIDLIEPTFDDDFFGKDPSNPDDYVSKSDLFQGYNFKNYVKSIDIYPDKYFDVVFIDGRARPSCFKHAIPKVKINGYIVWDNTDREYYFFAMQKAPKSLDFIDFPGPSPYVNFFTRTSGWHVNNE